MVYPSNITLNLNTRYVLPIPTAQQGDTARVLTFNILDKGVPFNLEGKTVRAKILKPDNTKCYNDLTITNATGGECDLKLTNQVLAVAGKVNCQLEIKEGEELLSTIIFPIDVEPSIDINGAVESTNEFTALLNGIIKLDEWDKYFKETSGAIEEKYTERLNGIASSLGERIKYYNNVVEMKADTTLSDGRCVKTLGYYNADDGGGTDYIKQGEQYKFLNKDYVMPEWFGAYGDGVQDDTQAFKLCLEHLPNKILLSSKTYLLSDDIRLGKITIEGAGVEKTMLKFLNGKGIIIEDRQVRLRDFTIGSANHGQGKGIAFKNKNIGKDTITNCNIQRLDIIYFMYALYGVDSASWGNVFRDLCLRQNTHAIYFDSLEKSLSASHFANEFTNITGDSNNGYVYFFRGASCVLTNCNFSCNNINCVKITSSNIKYNSCYFETDKPISTSGSLLQLDSNVSFYNCRFLHQFITDGNNYIMSTTNVTLDKKISIVDCKLESYRNSKLTNFCDPTFGQCPSYGSVYVKGNNFSVVDCNYNQYKPYIVEDETIRLYHDGNIELNKLKRGLIYSYRKNSTDFIPATYNGTNLIDVNGDVLK